jgi:6-phosphofructokinase 1
LVPEFDVDLDQVCHKIEMGYEKGKAHSIIVVAEGFGGSPVAGRELEESAGFRVGRYLREKTGFDTRITILGHIQRGGTPTVLDRTIATLSGAKAVQLLAAGEKNKMVGFRGSDVVVVDFEEVFSSKKSIDRETYELANILSLA